jgi:hypothetical protein
MSTRSRPVVAAALLLSAGGARGTDAADQHTHSAQAVGSGVHGQPPTLHEEEKRKEEKEEKRRRRRHCMIH